MVILMSKNLEETVRTIFGKRKPKSNLMFMKLLNDAVIETQLNGGEIMYFSGKYIGSKIMEVHQKEKKNNIPVVIKKTLENLEMGDIVGISIKGNNVFLELKECPFKSTIENNCEFLQGILAGIISQGSGKPYKIKSVKCKGAKNLHCIFHLTSVSR